MSDQDDPTRPAVRTRATALGHLWNALRGLGIGIATTVIAGFTAWGLLKLVPADDSPCSEDSLCLPDLGPAILAIASLPCIVALVGPLIARLFRCRRPWLFAIPAIWVVALAGVTLGPGSTTTQWPFNSVVSVLLILWIPYCLIGPWAFRRPADTERP